MRPFSFNLTCCPVRAMVAPADTALLVCTFMLQVLTAVKVLVVLAQSLCLCNLRIHIQFLFLIVGRAMQLTSCHACLRYAFKIWSARTKLTGLKALCRWIGQLVRPVTNRKVIEKFHSLQCQLLIKALQVLDGQKHARHVFPTGKWGSLDRMSALRFLLFVSCCQW